MLTIAPSPLYPLGIFNSVYKLLGIKSTSKETRYELVQACTESSSEDIESDEATSDSDNEDEETVVVFRRSLPPQTIGGKLDFENCIFIRFYGSLNTI